MMQSSDRFSCGLLIFAVGLSRLLFRSHYLYDIDSVNYALALDRFDPSVHQPHPPGYFLYIELGRLFRLIFQDSNTALVAISILASCAAAVMIYILAENWFGGQPALFAGLIFAFSPLSWFHGTVALTYILEAFFSALIGYFCWRAYSRDSGFLVAAAIALGLAAGFRQSSLLFLGPLWFLSMRRSGRKEILVAWLALTVTLLAWFVPMVIVSGGMASYFHSLSLLWRMAVAKQTALDSLITMWLARIFTILGITVICYGGAIMFLFRPRRTALQAPELETDKRVFTWIWLAPGLLFFTFVFIRWVNSGYLLVVAPPVFAWLGAWMSDWYSDSPGHALPKTVLAGALAVAGVACFLYAPLYCSFRSLRERESELDRIQHGLGRVASCQDTLIIGFDSHFLGYRHAGYYFPRYLTVQYPELSYPDGKRVLAVEARDTHLLSRLPLERFKRFVFFPLPPGEEYDQYVANVRLRFPEGKLTSTFANGNEYFSGSIADLSFLFPEAGGLANR
jgi:4-amino-4-deoxy-L-arabinose transferase-like glycosyltransferase